MLFNSLEFAFFLPVVFILYWFVFKANLTGQNIFLTVVSYFFYGWWDWRFLSLIIFSSIIDYSVGQKLGKAEDKTKRKRLLWLSLAVNLGLLGFFKYFNFFIENFVEAFTLLGHKPNIQTLNILLPVGISFYTFQTLSYTLDIYAGRIKPVKDIFSFLAFVSFFPQLVAGPIERATNFLPQFQKTRIFEKDKAIDGLRQMLWGLFKKILIADGCAPIVTTIFDQPEIYSFPTLLLGSLLFIVQIYCDFSGYSDIAIGTARLFGFNLMKNFATPYLSVSTTEIWRRWHISLGTWANSYIFNPLAKSYGTKMGDNGIVLSLIITFTLIGFWHGANWTFIIYGLIHGTVLGIEFMTTKRRRRWRKKYGKSINQWIGWFITIIIWILTCVIFRSESIMQAFLYLNGLLLPSIEGENISFPYIIIFFIIILFVIEWFQKKSEHGLEISNLNIYSPLRWTIYMFIIFSIFFFGNFNQEEFIYFQF